MPRRKPGAPPKKKGPKRFSPSDELRREIRAKIAFRWPVSTMCRDLGISDPTFRRAFKLELVDAPLEATSTVIKSLYDMAVGVKGSPGDPARGINPVWEIKPIAKAAADFLELFGGYTRVRPGDRGSSGLDADIAGITVEITGGLPDVRHHANGADPESALSHSGNGKDPPAKDRAPPAD